MPRRHPQHGAQAASVLLTAVGEAEHRLIQRLSVVVGRAGASGVRVSATTACRTARSSSLSAVRASSVTAPRSLGSRASARARPSHCSDVDDLQHRLVAYTDHDDDDDDEKLTLLCIVAVGL